MAVWRRLVMNTWVSMTLQCVLIIMRAAPWPLFDTATYDCAGVFMLDRTVHILWSFHKACLGMFLFLLNTVTLACIELVAILVEVVSTGLELKRTTFCSVRNILSTHSSIDGVLGSMLMERSSTVQNRVHTIMSQMEINWRTMPSMFKSLHITVFSCNAIIGLTYSI